MAEAAENNTEATQIIALGDEDDRKLFVGGLPQDATQDDISQHFKTFGEIENINLKTDQSSGRSRGFAFVLYKTVDSLNNAIDTKEHTVKGKTVAVKKAQAKQGKIYVGKLKPEVSDEDIKKHFTQYGSIAVVEQPFDKAKNERKNFCFITFDKEDSAKQLLKLGTTTINGVELDIKRVTVKDPAMGGMGRGGNTGRGGGVIPGYGYNFYGAGYGYGDPYSYGAGWGGYGSFGAGGGGWNGYGAGYMKNGYGMGGRGGPGGMRGGRGGPKNSKPKPQQVH